MDEEEKDFSLKYEGDWEEIVEKGEELEEAMEKTDVDDRSKEEFGEWRPKENESYDEDMPKKTAESSSVGPTGDKPGSSTKENVEEVKDVLDDKNGEEKSLIEAVYILVRDWVMNTFQRIEEFVYENIITKAAHHSEEEDVQTRMKKKSNLLRKILNNEDEDKYMIRVFFSSKEDKKDVKEELDKKEKED